jgi:hypothetical protein
MADDDAFIMRRDRDTIIAKATAALETSVKSIIGCDDDDATKCKALAETFGQFATYMENVGKQRDDQNFRSTATGAIYPRGDRLRVFEDLFDVNGDDDDADRDDDADADDVEKSVDHAASTVADLLVESGRFPHSGAALDHLLNSRHGNALLGRLHKAAKGETMRGDNLESILKDCGPVRLCKGIVERQRSPCTEAELVAVLTKHAGGDRAFAKLCETEPNVLRACSIAKAAEFAAFDDTPMVVGGADARDVDNATAAVRAYEEIVRIGREKFPFLRADQQFARVNGGQKLRGARCAGASTAVAFDCVCHAAFVAGLDIRQGRSCAER